MAVLQMVERPSADKGSTRVEAVPNPDLTPSADFKSGEGWPLLTGAQDIVRIASSFATEGFDVRRVTLVDRFFQAADDDDSAAIADLVQQYIQANNIQAAVAAFRTANLFVETVRLFKTTVNQSVDIRQNGVIIAKNIELNLIDQVLRRAFSAR